MLRNPEKKEIATQLVALFVPTQLTEKEWEFPTSQGLECKCLRNDGGEFSVIKVSDAYR
jgi:hypothetical protein